ncbi:hypothetical protein M8J77_025851 [Diaphorina citri]|nr:hypothetical protein M8J77_025851 [Diaphorina citri]
MHKNIFPRAFLKGGSKSTWNKLRSLGLGKIKSSAPLHVGLDQLNQYFVSVVPIPCPSVKRRILDGMEGALNANPVDSDASFNFVEVSEADVNRAILSIKSKAGGCDGMDGTMNVLDPFQSGFRRQHCTATALVKVTDDIRLSLDAGKVTFLVLLDMSKAFDSVDFDILLVTLKGVGLSEIALSWLAKSIPSLQICLCGRYPNLHSLYAGGNGGHNS